MASLDEILSQATTSGETVDTFAPAPGYRPDIEKEKAENAPSLVERFAVNNPVGSYLYKQKMLPGIDLYGGPESGFDFTQYLNSPLRQEYAEFFIGAKDETEMDRIEYFIQEREDIKKRSVEDPTWSGLVSEFAVGAADPFNLLPGGTLVRAASKGLAVAKSAASVGAAASGSMAASEILLQQTAPERSLEESAINTAGALVLGGILGGGVAALSKGLNRGLAEQIMDELHFNNKEKVKINEDGSLSAAEYKGSESRMAAQDRTSKFAEALLQPNFLKTTVVRGLNSTFRTTSHITDMFLDHNFTLNRHLEGRSFGPSAEALVKEADDKLFAQVERPLKQYFKEYIGLDPQATGLKGVGQDIQATIKQLGRNSTRLDSFSAEIARELRTPGSSSNAAVIKASKTLRKIMDEKANKLMKYEEFAHLKELTPERRATYLSRRWLRKRIIAEGQNGRFFKMLKDDMGKYYKLSDDEATKAASDAIESMTRQSDEAIQMESLGFNIKGAAGKLNKQRTLHFLDDNKYSEYLENDAIALSMHYAMSADRFLAHKETLARAGYDSIVDVQKSLRDEYELGLSAIERNSSLDEAAKAKARTALTDEFDSNRELVNLMSDLVLGRSDKNDRAISKFLGHVRRYNVITLLGGMVISALPDMALQVAKHGLKPIAKDLILPLLTDFKSLKLSVKELDQLAIAFDEQNNQILQAFSDTTFRTGDLPTHWEKVSNTVTESFSTVSVSKYWNGFGQRISGHMSSQFLMEIAEKVAANKTLSQKELVRLSKGNIDVNKMKAVAEQFKRHGAKQGRGYLLNVSEWTDAESIDLVTRFIRKEIDEVIIRPGMGDTPTYVKQYGSIGATQFQFQTFTSALVNKVVLPNVQDRQANMAIAFAMAITLGNLVEYIKGQQKGKKFESELDNVIFQGLSRSGMLGLTGSAALTINPFGEYGSRFTDRTIVGLALGPSLGTAERLSKASVSVATGSFEDSDLKNIKTLIPYQNLFYLNRLLEKAFGIDE